MKNYHNSPDWTSISLSSADELAAEIVCNWPHHIGFDPVINDLDYSIPLRQTLWPIVASAVRETRNSEPTLLKSDYETLANEALPEKASSSNSISSFSNRSLSFLKTLPRSISFIGTQSNAPFVPFPHASWDQTLKAIDEIQTYAIELPMLFFRRRQQWEDGLSIGFEFANRIVEAFEKWGLYLPRQLSKKIRNSISLTHQYLTISALRLRNRTPDLFIASTAATSPSIEFLLVAKIIGAKTVSLQYGLDCDRYAYEEIFSHSVAVWSASRRTRYLNETKNHHCNVCITGNPEFDHRKIIKVPRQQDSFWLWVTRPHSPNLCKLPSQSPSAGLQILQTFFKALASDPTASLVIKTHPNDYKSLYRIRVRESDFADRIDISNQSINSLLQQASIVITEDTSAGMDSMFFGKPLIHLHFSKTPAFVPFVDFGAALPAFNEEELLYHLRSGEVYSKLHRLQKGQIEFLHDSAGLLDGQSSVRLTQFLKEIRNS